MSLFSAQHFFLNIMYFTVPLEVICVIGQNDCMFDCRTEILKYTFIHIRLRAAYHVNKVRQFNMSCLHLFAGSCVVSYVTLK